jgi:hypothetical protein
MASTRSETSRKNGSHVTTHKGHGDRAKLEAEGGLVICIL